MAQQGQIQLQGSLVPLHLKVNLRVPAQAQILAQGQSWVQAQVRLRIQVRLHHLEEEVDQEHSHHLLVGQEVHLALALVGADVEGP